jgi:zinc transport system ATP-binding protein
MNLSMDLARFNLPETRGKVFPFITVPFPWPPFAIVLQHKQATTPADFILYFPLLIALEARGRVYRCYPDFEDIACRPYPSGHSCVRYPAGKTSEPMSDILLEVKDFKVSMDGSPVLSDLNFTVEEGEFLTILGPNGSGKTVLVKALLGLVAYEGMVNWHRKAKVGYLPQGLNQMSVRDMPLTVKDFFALKKLKSKEVLNYLSRVGLDKSVLNKRAGYLSGGEFQRMLVAWVLGSRPNVLFLDEPTTAVDIAGGETIYSLLRNIWQEQNLTVFNVTHDLNIVFAHSTHVLCLSRFRHLCYGVPREVLTPEILSDIYGADVKFHTH